MRLLKIVAAVVIVAVALFAGVFVVAALFVVGTVYFLVQRLRGKPAIARFGTAPRPRETKPTGTDIIDVTATEIRSERLQP